MSITFLLLLNLVQPDRIYAREEDISVTLRFIIFVCSLFGDVVSNSPDHTETNVWMTVNHELERIWKEGVVA
jgi:hypothetical protein